MEDMNMIKVLGIFTCYNRKNMSLKCIESLMQDKSIEWQFIVVDDNSNDGTKEALQKYNNVFVIAGDGNLYYSGGMNIGMKNAQDYIRKNNNIDYVMMLNNDVNFHNGAIGKIIQISRRMQNAVIAGSTEGINGEFTYGGIVKTSSWRPKTMHVMDKNKLVKCDTCNGNCVLIPKDIFMDVPIMDSKYRHSFGDYDYGFSITKRGYSILASNFYVGICEDDHVKEKTWEDCKLSVKERIERKRHPLGHPGKIWFYYLNKNYGFFTAILYSINDFIKIIMGR